MKNIQAIIFTALATVSAVILRCLQLGLMIDPKTGFTNDNMAIYSILITVITLVFCLTSAAIVFLKKDNTASFIPPNSSLLGFSNLVLGIFLLIEPTLSSIVISNVPKALCFFRVALLILSGIVYIYFGIAMLFHLNIRYGLCVVPIVLWIVRLMCTFISYTVMSNISDNFYNISCLIFTLLFLMYQGKTLCLVGNKNRVTCMYACGSIAVILSFTAALPHLLLPLFGKNFLSHGAADHPAATLIMAFYIVIYTCAGLKQRDHKKL